VLAICEGSVVGEIVRQARGSGGFGYDPLFFCEAFGCTFGEAAIDQRTLGERISLDRSTMAEVVARLCARGLIETARDVHDGRRKTIRLTPKGVTTLQQLIPRTHVMTRRLVGALDSKEKQELLRLLSTVVASNERLRVQSPGKGSAES
jgi:DNA-binding MarR family transcriptional regulator